MSSCIATATRTTRDVMAATPASIMTPRTAASGMKIRRRCGLIHHSRLRSWVRGSARTIRARFTTGGYRRGRWPLDTRWSRFGSRSTTLHPGQPRTVFALLPSSPDRD